MIPSDHFVKFYSEIFKYLARCGDRAVQEYYETIFHHQETHCLEMFQQKGLDGMAEYWNQIKREENCDVDTILEGEGEARCYKFIMHGCPSLGKVLDNDAGASPIYCNHCSGWIMPLITEVGHFVVYDLVGMDIPRCVMAIFRSEKCARDYREIVRQRHPEHPELVKSNFD